MPTNSGASLVEVILVISVLSGLTFLLANIPNSFHLINTAKHLSIAREIGTKLIEDKRGMAFENLVDDSLPITDPRVKSLPFGSGTVTLEDCPQTVCLNNELVKQLTIKIDWKEETKPQETTIVTLIGKGGVGK